MPARNTLVQLLALYTHPESQNAQRYRQTDRRANRPDYANSRSYCVAAGSAKYLKHDSVDFWGFFKRQKTIFHPWMETTGAAVIVNLATVVVHVLWPVQQ